MHKPLDVLRSIPSGRSGGHLYKIARVCQICLGVVFLVAGISKIIDPVAFFWQIIPFSLFGGRVRDLILASDYLGPKLFVLGFAPLEIIVGTALLVNWRPKITVPSTGALLTAFMTVMGYALRRGVKTDCGCFGALIHRTPAEAMIEDLLMLAAVGFIWWGLRGPRPSMRWGRWAVIGAGAVALLINGASYFANHDRIRYSDLKVGARLRGVHIGGLNEDLRREEHLVILFSTECPTCQDMMPLLSRLATEPNLPSAVGLCPNNAEQISAFSDRFNPPFPIGRMPLSNFLRLIGIGRCLPRVASIRDGVVQQIWEKADLLDAENLERMVEVLRVGHIHASGGHE